MIRRTTIYIGKLVSEVSIARSIFSLFAFLLLVVSTSFGQEALFERGNSLYQEGDYEAATQAYLQILDAGYESSDLFFNIGNSYFKRGDLGRSILFYERALRLNGRNDAARYNLDLAESLTADEIEPLPGFLPIKIVDWWVQLLPKLWLRWIVGLSYLLGMSAVLLAVISNRSQLVVWGKRFAVVAGIVVLVLGVNLLSIELGIGQPTEAIVLADEISVQSAPSDDSALQVFTIHEGTKARIDQQSGEWAEIVLADGKVGWVKLEALEII